MKLNKAFGFGISKYGLVNKVGFTCCKGRKYGINLVSGVESVILSKVFLFTASTFSFASPLAVLIGRFIFCFHIGIILNKLITFAEPYRNGGWVPANPLWILASYLKAYSKLPNLECYFKAHNVKDFGGFLLTPFQAFQIPLCNPSLITLQR